MAGKALIWYLLRMSSRRRSIVFFAASSALAVAAACVGSDDPTTVATGTDSGGGGSETGTGPGTDATTTADTSTPTDGAVDTDSATPPACNVAKPFQTPSRVDDVFTTIADDDDGARLSPNGLELFLARKLNGTTTRIIHQYRRTSLTAPWTNDTTIAQLSKTAANVNTTADLITLTPSGTTAFFQFYYSPPSDNKGIFVTTRTGLNAVDWTAPATIVGMGSDQGFGDEAPFLTADGKHLYFFSKRADGANFHAMHADVTGTTVSAIDRVHIQFPNATNPPNEFATIVTPDERTLYFASYTTGIDSGVQQRYLYTATRATTASDFTQAQIVPELYVDGAFTSPTWVSADGCTILFISNRAPGGYHVWSATKPKT